jgi:signal-transduction protein with cAMP-binding, CBS, and nucleotidyltransferase domain
MEPMDMLRALPLGELHLGPGELEVDFLVQGSLRAHPGEIRRIPVQPFIILAMPTAPVEALRKVPLFQELDDNDLERLSRQMKERTFPEGASVTTAGDTGAGFFVITEGNATVSVGGEVKATLGPGDYFGEVALIDEGVRSATITAATDLQCYGLTPWEFRPFVEEHPQVAWKLLKTLAGLLRTAQGG